MPKYQEINYKCKTNTITD